MGRRLAGMSEKREITTGRVGKPRSKAGPSRRYIGLTASADQVRADIAHTNPPIARRPDYAAVKTDAVKPASACRWTTSPCPSTMPRQ